MGFHSDMSSFPNSTPTSSSSGSSGSSKPSTTLAAAGHATASSLTEAPTGDAPVVQSNVDLFVKDEVDGGFRHHPNSLQTRSRRKLVSPRLKQTNVPIVCVGNASFDELVGVEFVEDVMSSSDGFEVSTAASSMAAGAEVSMWHDLLGWVT